MTELTIKEAIRLGIEAHKAGKVQEADKYYTAVLQTVPDHPDANHNMGVLAVGVGKVEEALPFFKKAIDANASIEQFWVSLIDALLKLDRFKDAEGVLYEAKQNGLKDNNLNQFKEKIERKLDGVIRLSDKILDQLINLYKSGDFLQTLNLANEYLKKYPNSVELHNIVGISHAKLGQYEQAVSIYKTALQLAPEAAEIHNNLGIN